MILSFGLMRLRTCATLCWSDHGWVSRAPRGFQLSPAPWVGAAGLFRAQDTKLSLLTPPPVTSW